MLKVVDMQDYEGGIDAAIQYYHDKWGNEENYAFFEDAIKHSSKEKTGLPRFFVLVRGDKIIGCCGLIANDFISRHDLLPWLAGVFIEESERGKALGDFMMNEVEKDAKRIGYSSIYLTTDHDGYYEKYGWKRMEDGYERSGDATRIYTKQLP
jgi:N-acetylglutamate synthase-like GNAT family acetyltransferase